MKKIILGLFMLTSAIGAAQPGTLDGTFNSLGAGANVVVLASTLQSDGKIIIGGVFTNYEGTGNNRIARLNADGTKDISFAAKCNDIVFATAVQADGKILIGGDFTTVNATSGINRITRLNANGSIDASFNSGVAANQRVTSIGVLPDGKILIGGNFTEYNGITRNSIARLNSDGTIDETFNPGIGASSSIYCLAVQSDGRIIIGGKFATYNGVTKNKIARLEANGAIDASFATGTGASSDVHCLAIQPDGKIIVGGNFGTFNGVLKNRIARLNTDGTLDASFVSGTGANKRVYAISILDNDKIAVGGDFDAYNGVTRSKIAVINSDGTLDTSFKPGTGFVKAVRSITLQDPYYGKLIVGGDFTSYNGTAVKRIARINSKIFIVVNMQTPNNYMLPLLSTEVYAETYTYPIGVKTYRFSITNNVTNVTQEVLTTKRFVAIPFSMRQFGATYDIKASAVIDGELVTYAGNTITVSTPYEATVKLASSSCGATVSHIANVYGQSAQGATAYKFNIYDATGSNLIGSVETPNNYFRFSEINFDFGTTYSVKVQVKIDGLFGAEGDACNVTLTTPTTTLAAFSCGATVSPVTTNVYTIGVIGATGYIFNIYDATGSTLVASLDKSTDYFRFNEIAYVPGASYMVKVQVKRGVIVGVEGAACQVTLMGVPVAPARFIEQPFTAVAYPNPFVDSFLLDVTSSYKSTLDIKVYDMLGRLVEQRQANINELEATTIGANYPSGVYNVIVTQDDQTKAVRVVKR